MATIIINELLNKSVVENMIRFVNSFNENGGDNANMIEIKALWASISMESSSIKRHPL
ncbi:MAG: hypothetical protein Hyperionvirus38_16 [Hyperionvirus sp.]|uniref:Uncharacterized protein n=1 Tax=Hyperionvirus sp. TaxID=2487770 RepID=A0A3G5ABZ1_9VIRU|nr:MAG: hypothetical protein Hyperionvirus38_16 [Hyperionvirus sp.]